MEAEGGTEEGRETEGGTEGGRETRDGGRRETEGSGG